MSAAAVSRREFDTLGVARRVLDVEARALDRTGRSLGSSFVAAVELFGALKGRIVCTGVGKSGHVARKIAATLASTGRPALFVHAGEASHGDLGMIGGDDAILALSKSGEARELGDVIAYAKRFAIPLVALTEAAESTLGRAADVLLLLPASPEAGEAVDAPTTSTTVQMALGDALAVTLLERKGFTANDFGVFHPGGRLGAALRSAAELMHVGGEVPLIPETASMADTLLVMTEKRFGCAGVVDAERRLVGIITDGDLRRHMCELMDHRACEVMTRDPKTAHPAMLAGQVLKMMNDSHITVVFVVEDTIPVGIIHIHDLLRAGVV